MREMRMFGCLLLSILLGSPVFADTTSNFLKAYTASRNFSELAEKLKPGVSKAHYEFFKKMAETELKGQSLPTLSRGHGSELVFTLQNLIVPVESKISSPEERVLSVNRRAIAISKYETPDEQFQAILKALPSTSGHWMMDLVLPEARAQLGLLVRGAKWAAGAISAGALAYDAYTNNSFSCDYLSETLRGCLNPLNELNDLNKPWQKKIDEAQKKGKSRPLCPRLTEDQKTERKELANSASEAVSNLEKKLEAGYLKVTVGCEKERQQAQACITSIKTLSQNICLELHPSLNKVLHESQKYMRDVAE